MSGPKRSRGIEREKRMASVPAPPSQGPGMDRSVRSWPASHPPLDHVAVAAHTTGSWDGVTACRGLEPRVPTDPATPERTHRCSRTLQRRSTHSSPCTRTARPWWDQRSLTGGRVPMTPRLRWAALAVALSCLAGVPLASAAPAPVPCNRAGDGRYNCEWYVPGDGRTGGAKVMLDRRVVGYLHQGTNWIACQQRGAMTRSA